MSKHPMLLSWNECARMMQETYHQCVHHLLLSLWKGHKLYLSGEIVFFLACLHAVFLQMELIRTGEYFMKAVQTSPWNHCLGHSLVWQIRAVDLSLNLTGPDGRGWYTDGTSGQARACAVNERSGDEWTVRWNVKIEAEKVQGRLACGD